jgi:hypothetical protein
VGRGGLHAPLLSIASPQRGLLWLRGENITDCGSNSPLP